jgi:hypothetical protein
MIGHSPPSHYISYHDMTKHGITSGNTACDTQLIILTFLNAAADCVLCPWLSPSRAGMRAETRRQLAALPCIHLERGLAWCCQQWPWVNHTQASSLICCRRPSKTRGQGYTVPGVAHFCLQNAAQQCYCHQQLCR